eukprot:gene18164-21725_t
MSNKAEDYEQQGGRIRAIPSRPRRLFRDNQGRRYIRKRGNRIYIKSKKDDKQLIRAMIPVKRRTLPGPSKVHQGRLEGAQPLIDYGAIKTIQDNQFRELMLRQRDKPNDVTRGIENKVNELNYKLIQNGNIPDDKDDKLDHLGNEVHDLKLAALQRLENHVYNNELLSTNAKNEKRVAELELNKLEAESKMAESDEQRQALEMQITDLETKRRHAEENAIAYQDLIKHDEEQYNIKIAKIKQDSDEKARRLEEELKKAEEDMKELIAKHKIHTKALPRSIKEGDAPRTVLEPGQEHRGADRTGVSTNDRTDDHDAPLINLFRPYTAAMNGAKKGATTRKNREAYDEMIAPYKRQLSKDEQLEVGKAYDEVELMGYNDLDARNDALTGVYEMMRRMTKRPFVDRQVNLGDRSPSRDQSGDGNVCTCGGNGEGTSQVGDRGGLYNTEIEHIMKPYHKDGFVGVISSDQIHELPSSSKVASLGGLRNLGSLSFIMNLDPSNKPGTLGENRLFSSCTTSRQ